MISMIKTMRRKLKRSLRLLIHVSARGDAIERIRHRAFIASHLGSALLAAAALPVYLIIVGTGDYVGLVIFLGLITPAYIATFLSRTGKLAIAHLLSAINLTALVMFTAAFTGGITSFVMAWMIVVPVESAFSGSKKVIAASLALSCASVVLLVYADFMNLLPANRVLNQDNTLLIGISFISAVAYISGMVVNTQMLHEKATALIQHGERKFRLLAENATDMITYHNHLGEVLFCSGAAHRFNRLGESGILHHGFINLVHRDDRKSYLDTFSTAAANNTFAQAEFRLKSASSKLKSSQTDGATENYTWVEMRCKPLPEEGLSVENDDEVQQVRVVAVTRDISELKAQQIQITQARDIAEEASRIKTRFLANISHELRTPLNAIIGFSDLLSDKRFNKNVTSSQQDYIRLIHQSGSHLLLVVNDLLDMSMIESGKLSLKPEVFDLSGLIISVIKIMQVTADERSVRILPNLGHDVCEITADKRAVHQILFNLISNAVKFSHDGGEVQVILSANEDQISLSFVDNGIGISRDVIPKLCQPFVQAENSMSRSYEGAGLGLSLVAGFVELHGGIIDITSEISKGTCVTISIPRHFQAGIAKVEAETQLNKMQSKDIEQVVAGGRAIRSAGNAA
jgi:two-component system, cell cycle sensor histidine kinase DivJ